VEAALSEVVFKMTRTDIARRGEDAAAAYLERVGMTLADRNWRCALGEVDIVALDGESLVLVEVKTRRSEKAGRAEEAVSATKQRRIVRLAEAYVAEHGLEGTPVRFDVVAIRVLTGDRALLRHYRGAFEAAS
jgi:putative endonuclease